MRVTIPETLENVAKLFYTEKSKQSNEICDVEIIVSEWRCAVESSHAFLIMSHVRCVTHLNLDPFVFWLIGSIDARVLGSLKSLDHYDWTGFKFIAFQSRMTLILLLLCNAFSVSFIIILHLHVSDLSSLFKFQLGLDGLMILISIWMAI